MKVTEILMEEHELILEKIDSALKKIEGPDFKNLAYWTEFLNFLQFFADDYHHAKEEDIYFLWMKERDPTLEHGPLKCMLGEHEQSRELVQSAIFLLDGIRSKKIENWDLFKEVIGHYGQILHDHIDKENHVLYRIAENMNDTYKDGDAVMLPQFNNVTMQYESSKNQSLREG